MTLVSASDKEYVFKKELKLAGEWQGRETTVARPAPDSGDAEKPPPGEPAGEEKLKIKRDNTVIPRPGFGPQDCSAYDFVIQSSRSGLQLPGSPHLVIAPIDVIAVARCS